MTNNQVAELKALCEAATPTPWIIVREDIGDEFAVVVPVGVMTYNGQAIISRDGGLAPDREWKSEQIEADAKFITTSRNALPQLLDDHAAMVKKYEEAKTAPSICAEQKLREMDRKEKWREKLRGMTVERDQLQAQNQALTRENAAMRIAIHETSEFCTTCTQETCKYPCACINGSGWQFDTDRFAADSDNSLDNNGAAAKRGLTVTAKGKAFLAAIENSGGDESEGG